MLFDNVDDLYYACIEKIDPDIEIAEEYIIGCITYLKRKEDGRADRDRVRDDVNLNRGMSKYSRELTIIYKLSEDALSTLIASSIDLTHDVRHIADVLEKIQRSNYDEVEARNQATKARNASRMLERIAKLLTPQNKKSNQNQGSLFETADSL